MKITISEYNEINLIEIECKENISILTNLLNNNVDIPYFCMGGICGSCKSKVKVNKGVINDIYEQTALTDKEIENGFSLLCCIVGSNDSDIEIEI